MIFTVRGDVIREPRSSKLTVFVHILLYNIKLDDIINIGICTLYIVQCSYIFVKLKAFTDTMASTLARRSAKSIKDTKLRLF